MQKASQCVEENTTAWIESAESSKPLGLPDLDDLVQRMLNNIRVLYEERQRTEEIESKRRKLSQCNIVKFPLG